MENNEPYESLKNDSAPPIVCENMYNFSNNEYKQKNESRSKNKNNTKDNEFKSFSNENNIFLSENNIYSDKFQNNEDILYIKIPLNNANKNKSNNRCLKIDIDKMYLKELEKDNLLDLINFINDYCEIKINDDLIYFKHIYFKIEKSKENEYLMKLRNKLLNQLKEKIKKNIIEKGIKGKNSNQIKNGKNQTKQGKKRNDLNQNKNIINIENNIKKNIINESQNKNNNIDEKENKFFCQNYNKAFKDKHSCFKHLKNTHIFKCEKCEKSFNSNKKLKSHICFGIEDFKDNNSNFNQQYLNNIGNDINRQEELKSRDAFKRKEELRKKEKLKKQEEDESKDKTNYYYQCYHEGTKFQDEKSYIRHFKSVHPDDYPFYCSICCKGFYSYMAISNHCRDKGH